MAAPELILVVDDTETSRYNKRRILVRAGFDVIEASDGGEALRLVRERLPRLVLLDVNLPEIDGWEVCRRIKADPATASVLVLQVSATYVREEDTVRALEGGADACLTEPLEAPVLVATVKALLRARRAEDAVREALAGEQIARETAERANRAKDEFLAVLSHELRSPLAAILTWVTLLRSQSVNEETVAQALEAIERNTRLQIKLIEDLLDVSRIISGKTFLEEALVDLGSVVDAALDGARSAAEAKDVRLRASVDETVSPVKGDPGRLQQIVSNLVSNAVKFTPAGGWAEVRIERRESQIQICVEDSGRGIDPEFIHQIFEPFRQADASTTREEAGLGLGLAIVRHLVDLHGGVVEAESPGPGGGSLFTVRLPLPAIRADAASLDGGSQELADTDTAFGETVLAGVRALVVDDERDVLDAVAAVLESKGARVVSTSSASGRSERSWGRCRCPSPRSPSTCARCARRAWCGYASTPSGAGTSSILSL